MKTILWSLLALFLIGDAFFVLPVHLSSDAVDAAYYINYKKDSVLLRNVFPDSGIALKLNMPPGYERMYENTSGTGKHKDSLVHSLFVNVSVFHNLDFTALAFPFYKVTTFNGVIPFYSIIKASNETDSTALIGNIVVNGKVTVKGICTPLYARTLVEKYLANILKNEMDKIGADINRPPVRDTIVPVAVPEPVLPVRAKYRRKK